MNFRAGFECEFKTAAIVTRCMQHRLECEARHWLRDGYVTPQMVGELMGRIEKHRGVPAAVELREEMRRQWIRRAEWQADT